MNTLSIFVEIILYFDGQYYSTNEAFIKYVQAFGENFDKVMIYARVSPEHKKQSYVLDPIRFEVCPLPFYPSVVSLGWRGIILLPLITWKMWRDIDKWGIAWVCGPHPIAILKAFLCISRRKPFFIFVRENTVRMVWFRYKGLKRFVFTAIAWILEKIYRWIAHTHLTFVVGSELYAIYHRKGFPVHCTAVSLISSQFIISENDIFKKLENETSKLLCVSRLEPDKGLIYLLEALRVLKNMGYIFELDLIGDGADRSYLEEVTKMLGLEDIVHFVGYVPFGQELLQYYRNSDIFVLPSLTEGVPQVIIEAHASGTPVIASSVGGVTQIIEHKVTGWLVAPGNVQQLTDGILRLRSDRELTRQIALNSLRQIFEHRQEIEIGNIIYEITNFYGIGRIGFTNVPKK